MFKQTQSNFSTRTLGFLVQQRISIEICESMPPEMEGENTPQLRNTKTHISDQSILLPGEIIEEILSRLPVKSLLKFRCVSKPWRSLIGSKRFTQKHLDYSMQNANFAHHCIISTSPGPPRELRQCSLRSMLDDPFTDQFKTCDLSNVGSEPICIVGCCNGLVCVLLEGKSFMLWNPSTKMTKNLPAFDRKVKHGHIECYGFGLNESSGDYRVFGILSVFCVAGYEAIAKVYSLEANSWELVKYRCVYRVSPFGEGGKYASGRLHWPGTLRVDWDIASFDLGSLEFGRVERPSYPDSGFNECMGVIGGCLSMLCDYKSHLDVWIMKEYGVRESWDRVVTVTTVDNPMERLVLFTVGPNGEIILTYQSNCVIYYPEDNGYRHCQVKNLAPLLEAGIYAESLVSLVPYG